MYYTTTPTSYGNLALSTGTSGSILSAGTGSTYTWTNTVQPASVKIDTKGIVLEEGCDITIGKMKLAETLKAIESRLAILRPDPVLEKEWEELKQLGDAYRELEQEILEKMRVWETLKRVDD